MTYLCQVSPGHQGREWMGCENGASGGANTAANQLAAAAVGRNSEHVLLVRVQPRDMEATVLSGRSLHEQ